ncbi:hypothetical protein MTR_4g015360 [Medicago truncatula]|uniref:Uncharacterized protein n=1 Tax=Medicago truncatula TaxID=3880 RepID=G7JN07_MEDTR|nr:hypothetical protein MTR_4g015360 [Medicago truncatula]
MINYHFSKTYSFITFDSLILQEARVYAKENGLFFMETYAKSAANVHDVFDEIGESIPIIYLRSLRKKVVVLEKNMSTCTFYEDGNRPGRPIEAFKQASKPYQAFRRPDLGLKSKSMTGHNQV